MRHAALFLSGMLAGMLAIVWHESPAPPRPHRRITVAVDPGMKHLRRWRSSGREATATFRTEAEADDFVRRVRREAAAGE